MENKLFVYGTLADPEVQKKLWGRTMKGARDVLKGYEKSEIEIDSEVYPLIVPNELDKVQGLVIEMSDGELKKIDDYETAAYKREKITLESGISAWVYVKV